MHNVHFWLQLPRMEVGRQGDASLARHLQHNGLWAFTRIVVSACSKVPPFLCSKPAHALKAESGEALHLVPLQSHVTCPARPLSCSSCCMTASASTDLQTLLSLTNRILAALSVLFRSAASCAQGVVLKAVSTKMLVTSSCSASCVGK